MRGKGRRKMKDPWGLCIGRDPELHFRKSLMNQFKARRG